MPSNRRHERFQGTLTVQVTGDGVTRFGTIYDISAGGAFLEVSPLPAVGATIQVDISRGKSARVRLPATVRHYLSGLSGPRGLEGVGIAWGELAPAEQAALDELVARAAAGKSLRDDR